MYRVARHLAGSREEAEDLVQDTYARAFRSWQLVPAGDEPPRLAAADPHESQHRPRPAPATGAADAGARGEPTTTSTTGSQRTATAFRTRSAWDERLSQDDIVSALSAVPHDFRDVVVLVDIGDFSYADAAQILDIPIGTVMSRLHRGRRVLKRELAHSGGGGPPA